MTCPPHHWQLDPISPGRQYVNGVCSKCGESRQFEAWPDFTHTHSQSRNKRAIVAFTKPADSADWRERMEMARTTQGFNGVGA